MKNIINIAVVGLGQVGIYLLNELNLKKKDIEIKTGTVSYTHLTLPTKVRV